MHQHQPQTDLLKFQQERLVIFNEYSSDAFLKRISNFLIKQFIEKEAAFKILVQKLTSETHIPSAHV